MTEKTSSTLKVTVLSEWDGSVWSSDIYVYDDLVGCGTSPNGPLDVAGDVLYGDTNDHLNGDEGALARALASYLPEPKTSLATLSEQAFNLHQQAARNDYLGFAEQVERNLGDLALIVSMLAERVEALEHNQESSES